ncbi:hypothetical protein B566_EDAN009960 [Ephemera danica]|nr:hypothetical protein B566_EDAN009960 [Ephemera danica]
MPGLDTMNLDLEPPLHILQREAAEAAASEEPQDAPITTQATVGIIYPPPETASFVARNGPEFEARIKLNEQGNPKFNFLSLGDPYHAYYQHKVKEIREGKGGLELALPSGLSRPVLSTTQQQKQQEILKQVEQPFIPREPPVDFEFVADPPSISALDLDIVKLTAQFVARNGRQFLTNLMNREQRNYQFDFLRPQHSLFQYFTKLLEQYTKVKYRAEWLRHQEAQRQREAEEQEKERVAYAQIDWHDFVVVETVDYQPFEHGHFPPPTTPDEVGARVLMQERIEEGQEVAMQLESDGEDDDAPPARDSTRDNTQVQDMEEESSSDSEIDEDGCARMGSTIGQRPMPPGTTTPRLNPAPPTQPQQPQPPPLPPAPDKVLVKKGYDPKQVKSKVNPQTDEFLISPITGERIPASKVQEHMRIGLLDPRWVEQRDRHLKDRMNNDTVYAPGTAIDASLKQLAERRTDIFGVGDEETAIGKKIGEEDRRKDDKVTWDGHTSSVEAATRAARANITLEEQIHQIHKVKGLLPDEEKEKIGPKPNRHGADHVLIAASISKGPQPPSKQPPLPKPGPMMQPKPGPMGPMGMPPQPMLMVPNMPPQMRPPPLMARPAFPVPMKHPMEMELEEVPSAKKQRTEDTLIPEADFLATHKGPVNFKVIVPNMSEKQEFKLRGQTLSMTLGLQDTVAAIKARLHEETGMPPGKQKLHWEGVFFKDSNSLAYYNIMPNTIINLSLKERGGRKK